ncbi:TerD family protein [Streptomyces sp. NBC_01615]|uniref:TerD family protein n=1 Tax=Streptomyces sp. NBC_01615 TaxID=2975898 RepID=UPI00386C7139
MTIITKGANTPVPAGMLRVAVCRRNVPGTPAVDASALLLDAAGKVRGDADLVFYNQPAHPSGAVRHVGTAEGGGQLAEWLELDLPRVEPDVQRVVIAGSCDGGTFGAVPGLAVQALNGDGTVVAHYEVTDASSETAFVLGEFYRRNGEWKFRAVGQGYASGLAGLATDFGIAVEEPAEPAPLNAVPATTAGPVPLDAVPAKTAEPVPAGPVPADTVRPVPQDAVPFPFGPGFEPVVQRGRGQGVITVGRSVPPGPVIVEAWHEGEGYFYAYTLTKRNKDDKLVFNNTMTDFRGRALVFQDDDRRLRLRVTGDNDWTVSVQPLSVARHLTGTVQGLGPEVLVYTGTEADVDAEFSGGDDGDSSFVVWSADAHNLRGSHDLVFNDVGRLRQTAPLPGGPLLLLVEADGPWQLTARPLPAIDPGPAQASEPPAVVVPETRPVQPYAAGSDGVSKDERPAKGLLGRLGRAKDQAEHSGRGAKTVTLANPEPGRPAILEYSIKDDDGYSSYRIELLDEYDDTEKFMESSTHGTHGRVLLFGKGESEVRLRLERVGSWSLRLLPVEEATPLAGKVEGKGSTVFRYTGPPAVQSLRRLTRDDDWLDTWTVQADGKKSISASTAGRRRPVVGPLRVSADGYCYLLVTARHSTGWQIETAALDTVPAFDGKVSGQGYAVVRHTGPAAEMMVRYEARGMIDLIALWELDDRLEPIRRISMAVGLQPIPQGLVQVRCGGGKWSIEARG